jgi:hypothetical protein
MILILEIAAGVLLGGLLLQYWAIVWRLAYMGLILLGLYVWMYHLNHPS